MKQSSNGIWDRIRLFGRTPSESSVNPEIASHPRLGTRQLWGERFDVVAQGLAEGQVARFVEDLLARYNKLLDQQGPSGTASTYLQKVISEIQQVQATVTTQIQKDAEGEASRVVDEAREVARGIIAQARNEAKEIAALEANSILDSAKKKAEIAEGQIRLQTQLMQEKAQDQLRSYLQQEGSDAFRRLLAALKELGNESQRLDEEWKRRSARIWQGEDFRVILDFETSPALEENIKDAE